MGVLKYSSTKRETLFKSSLVFHNEKKNDYSLNRRHIKEMSKEKEEGLLAFGKSDRGTVRRERRGY